MRWQRSMTVFRAPRVRIAMYGGTEVRAMHRAFTARHRVFKMTAAKRWGVALIPLPPSFDEYLAGHSMWVLRQKLRLAKKHNFRYAVVSPQDYLDDILEVNRSSSNRQGRPMPASYVDRVRVSRRFEGQTTMHAVLDSEGRLRAYATVLACGDTDVFTVILGHADDLQHGTMYLLVSEVVRSCIDSRSGDGAPRWLMYDTYWGASKGLAFFKERLGFLPYTVDWAWFEPAAQA